MKNIDREHHEAGRDDCVGSADRVREGPPHHPAAGGDEHEEEGAEYLREEAAPFLARVVEVLNGLEGPLLDDSAECNQTPRQTLRSLRHRLPPVNAATGTIYDLRWRRNGLPQVRHAPGWNGGCDRSSFPTKDLSADEVMRHTADRSKGETISERSGRMS